MEITGLLTRFLCRLGLHRSTWHPFDCPNVTLDGKLAVYVLRYRRCVWCGSLREMQYRGEGDC